MDLQSHVLVGTHCVLRAMRPEYLEALTGYLNDPAVNRYLRIRPPVTHASQVEYFKRTTRSDRDAVFAVLAREADARCFVGVVGLHEIDPVDKSARGGAIIGNPAFQGRGIGTEARFLQLRFAFETLGLRMVFGSAIAFNERSNKLLARCGYVRIGTEPASRFSEGAYHDNNLYVVDREGWLRALAAYERSRS